MLHLIVDGYGNSREKLEDLQLIYAIPFGVQSDFFPRIAIPEPVCRFLFGVHIGGRSDRALKCCKKCPGSCIISIVSETYSEEILWDNQGTNLETRQNGGIVFVAPYSGWIRK